MKVARVSAIVLCLISLSAFAQQHQKQVKPSPASPQAVCSYITGKMIPGLPQVPTLCSAKETAPSWYDVSVFSPTDVLEHGMRRAWSTLLFQTLQEMGYDPSLHGACSEAIQCDVKISDIYLSQHQWHYSIFLNGRHSLGKNSDFSSDDSYFWAWGSLYGRPEVDHPQSKENAEWIARDACKDFVAAMTERWSTFASPTSHIPRCSVLLATDSQLYIVLDYTNILDAMLANNLFDLPKTIGGDLENAGYRGEVIIRSPWEHWNKPVKSGDQRAYKMIDLQSIVFLFQELRSGLRTDNDIASLIAFNYHFGAALGQTDQLAFSGTSKDAGFEMRSAHVVKLVTIPRGDVLMTLTDGSEWSIKQDSITACSIKVGSDVTAQAESQSATPEVFSYIPGTMDPCTLKATFVEGW
jgi:hypothetical protein